MAESEMKKTEPREEGRKTGDGRDEAEVFREPSAPGSRPARWARSVVPDDVVDATPFPDIVGAMKREFTAIIEAAPAGGFWATCPEVPGANGQGETVEEAKASAAEAIRLILEDRVEDARRGLPADAIQTVVAV